MSYSGQGGAGVDPFGGADYTGAPASPSPYGSGPPQTYGSFPSPEQPGEVNTLATLSVVFAFVFAPAGAVLGHLALSQIKHRSEPGHRRAVVGLTLSYIFIALAVIALIIWLLLGTGRGGDRTTTPTAPPPPSVQSTVITPPAQGRPRVGVAELRPGDCIEIQKNQPDPNRAQTDDVYIYRVPCATGGDVFQVQQKVSNPTECPQREYLANEQQTIFACFVKYGSGT